MSPANVPQKRTKISIWIWAWLVHETFTNAQGENMQEKRKKGNMSLVLWFS
jgi:hypothetical protein